MFNLRNPILRGIYRAVAPVVADLQSSLVRIDSDAILLVRTVGPAPSSASLRYFSGASPLVAQGTIKASAGTLRLIQGTQYSGSNLYLQLFDQAAAPVNNDVPVWPSLPIPTTLNGTPFGFAFSDGMPFATKIFWAFSTTSDKLTLPVPATVAQVGALYV